MPVSRRTTRFLWTAVLFLVVIGIAAVSRRALVLLWPAQFGGKASPAAALDAGFARHMALTLIHILPGGLFLGLAPLQFIPSVRQKHLQVHRWTGRILVACGLVVGVSALVMSYTMNIGGPNETAATTLFAIVFLICLIKAYLLIRRKDVEPHREWMIRAFGGRPGRGHDAAHCRNVFRLPPAHPSRILWDCILAGIHDHVSCR